MCQPEGEDAVPPLLCLKKVLKSFMDRSKGCLREDSELEMKSSRFVRQINLFLEGVDQQKRHWRYGQGGFLDHGDLWICIKMGCS